MTNLAVYDKSVINELCDGVIIYTYKMPVRFTCWNIRGRTGSCFLCNVFLFTFCVHIVCPTLVFIPSHLHTRVPYVSNCLPNLFRPGCLVQHRLLVIVLSSPSCFVSLSFFAEFQFFFLSPKVLRFCVL